MRLLIALLALSLLLFLFPLRRFFLANWRRVVPLYVGLTAGVLMTSLFLPQRTSLWIRLAGTAFCALMVNGLLLKAIDRFFPSGGQHGH